jgi:hypothetical protein
VQHATIHYEVMCPQQVGECTISREQSKWVLPAGSIPD